MHKDSKQLIERRNRKPVSEEMILVGVAREMDYVASRRRPRSRTADNQRTLATAPTPSLVEPTDTRYLPYNQCSTVPENFYRF
jgi:hypothetical protein